MRTFKIGLFSGIKGSSEHSGSWKVEDRRKFTDGLPEVETLLNTSQGNLTTTI